MIRLGREFQVVMWDILSLDYRTELTGETVANNVIQNATSGSIVLMHDSDLAAERVLAAIPRILTHFTENGFRFCTLDQ
jgi:peptidoglycan/xylan/chitin deacetylase (PgdA/CDA1 family)